MADHGGGSKFVQEALRFSHSCLAASGVAPRISISACLTVSLSSPAQSGLTAARRRNLIARARNENVPLGAVVLRFQERREIEVLHFDVHANLTKRS